MEKYLTPSIDIVSIEIETTFAASPGFNMPDGGNNGSENWDSAGSLGSPANWD